MIYRSVKITLLALVLPSAAMAADCGEQPYDLPTLPIGASATPEQMAEAREAVIGYSKRVDDWLLCMNERTGRLGTFLTRDQRARLSEDLTAVHEKRQTLQRAFNAAIREYRNARRDG